MSQHFFSQHANNANHQDQQYSSQRKLSQASQLSLQGNYQTQTLSQEILSFDQPSQSQFSGVEKMKQPNQTSARQGYQPQAIGFSSKASDSNDLQTLINYQSANADNGKLPRNKSVPDFTSFQEMMNQQEQMEQSVKDHIEKAVLGLLPGFQDKVQQSPTIDDQMLFELATHKNPAIVYLCEQIENADKEFQNLQQQAKMQLQQLIAEWQSLKLEVQDLQKIDESMEQDLRNPRQSRTQLEPVETLIKISEDLMRDSRADRIMLFLKLRYKDQIDCSNERLVQDIKNLYKAYQEKLSDEKVLDLQQERQCVDSFLKDLEKKGLYFNNPIKYDDFQEEDVTAGTRGRPRRNNLSFHESRPAELPQSLANTYKPEVKQGAGRGHRGKGRGGRGRGRGKSNGRGRGNMRGRGRPQNNRQAIFSDDEEEEKQQHLELSYEDSDDSANQQDQKVDENDFRRNMGGLGRFIRDDNSSSDDNDFRRFPVTKIKQTIDPVEQRSLNLFKDALIHSMKGTMTLNGKKRKLF